jgi:hypothetical protein
MMTPEELKARAERADKWLAENYLDHDAQYDEIAKTWEVLYSSTPDTEYFPEGLYENLTDAMFIAWVESLGFRDPIPTVAEAVAYLINKHGYAIAKDRTGHISIVIFPNNTCCANINPVEEALKLGYGVESGS